MVLLKRAIFIALCVACKPELGGRFSQIEGPRIIAVRSNPPEAAASDTVAYDVLEVDPNGETGDAIDWAYCVARKPLDDLDTVSNDCLAASGPDILELGDGTTANGTIPNDACRNFGPEVPAPKPGEPQGRPIDPDPTGGYYQPLRLLASAGTQIGTTRISCGVANASAPDTIAFRARYHPNTNPMIADVTSDDGTSLSTDANAPTHFAAGARVTLAASWATCPTSDTCGDGVCGADESATTCANDCPNPIGQNPGCTGAERYVHYNLETQSLENVRETLRASWFVTAGAFDSDRTGRDGTDLATSTTNALTLPASGAIHGWVVLRDDRGGVGWRRFEIAIN